MVREWYSLVLYIIGEEDILESSLVRCVINKKDVYVILFSVFFFMNLLRKWVEIWIEMLIVVLIVVVKKICDIILIFRNIRLEIKIIIYVLKWYFVKNI